MHPDDLPLRLRLLVPAALLAGGGLVLAALQPGHLGRTAALVGLYLVTPLGQEAWLAAARATFGLPLWYAAAVLFLVSAVQVLLFGYALRVESALARLPRLGERVRLLETRIHDRPSARRGVAASLFLLVVTPFHSGGAIVASLAGRAMGLGSGPTVAAVLGAIAVRFAVALAILAGLFAAFGW